MKETDGLLTEAKLAGAAWNMVGTVGEPAVVDAVAPDSTYNPSTGSASLENGIYVSLICDAANLGVLADTDFNPEKGACSWLDNENHTMKLIQGVVLKAWSESAAVMVCSNVCRGRR